MHAPLLGGEYSCKLLRLLSRDIAHTQALIDIDILKPLFRLVPIGDIFVYVVLVLPAFFKDYRNKRTHEQRVRAESGHDVHIRHAGRLRKAGIYDDDHLVGVLRELTADLSCVGDLMRDIGV